MLSPGSSKTGDVAELEGWGIGAGTGTGIACAFQVPFGGDVWGFQMLFWAWAFQVRSLAVEDWPFQVPFCIDGDDPWDVPGGY